MNKHEALNFPRCPIGNVDSIQAWNIDTGILPSVYNISNCLGLEGHIKCPDIR